MTESTERVIEFEKWKDPFSEVIRNVADDEDIDLDDFDDGPYPSLHKKSSKPSYSGPALVGPMGILPLTEENIGSANYDLWVGHANFDIGPTELMQIEHTDGVELLRVYSRYRFLLGVGKAFHAGRVLKAIEARLCSPPPETSTPESVEPPTQVEIVNDVLNAAFPFWAVALLEDEKLDLVGGDSREALNAKIAAWKEAGLEVFTSWGTDE